MEGCGRRMSDTWSSEIQKFTYGVIFQSLICWRLNELKKVKKAGSILPSGHRLPHRRLKNSLFELQSPPWFRYAYLGFGRFAGSGSNSGCFASLCSNLWSGILELCSDLECLVRVGFRGGSGVLFLYGLLPILNFVGSWTLVKPGAMPSAFWGIIQTSKIKG